MTKDPKKAINIRISYESWNRLRKICARRDMTIKDLIEELSKLK